MELGKAGAGRGKGVEVGGEGDARGLALEVGLVAFAVARVVQETVAVVEDVPLGDRVVAVVNAESLQRPVGDVLAAAAAVLIVGIEREALGPTTGIKLKELEQPYGIPYSCLLPAEYDNLIAASRGASFSHIAASSCRLSRTMMALREAAGEASALALRDGTNYADVDVDAIRERIGIPAFEEKALSVWGIQG